MPTPAAGLNKYYVMSDDDRRDLDARVSKLEEQMDRRVARYPTRLSEVPPYFWALLIILVANEAWVLAVRVASWWS